MEISDRIKAISAYFRGMQVEHSNEGDIIYVVLEFPGRWIIDNDIEDKFNVKVRAGNDYAGQYYFFADMETGFNAIFDAVDYNIKRMKEAQERAAMLTENINKLKELFSNEDISVEELRTLKFVYNESPLKKAGIPSLTDQNNFKNDKKK